MHVVGISEVQGYVKMFLSYRGTKIYEYVEKVGHGLSRNIIYNLRV